MGGCRCTYKNCTTKSDGKTHMFHYPVFDKVRCHQWLVNAHRLNFLNLKLSQLKNRVICQHHFKEDNFMNFKKDKLTFHAIPTEDGPFCDKTNYVDNNHDLSKIFSVMIDDIENEYITACDKKSNFFSMKYGDFLTNLDVMDVEKAGKNKCTSELKTSNTNIFQSCEEKVKINDNESFNWNVTLPDKCEKHILNQPTLVVPPYVNSANVSLNDSTLSNNLFYTSNIPTTVTNEIILSHDRNKEQINNYVENKPPKITILSEKKYTDPVPIIGKFEPVSPNFVLNISKIRNNRTECQDVNTIVNQEEVKQEESTAENDKKNIEIESELVIKEEDTSQVNFSTGLVANIDSEKPTKVSILKPRVPPERVEAIKRKRNFNMKLRDIIESCLDKLENSDKIAEEINSVENIETKESVKRPTLLKESSMPPSQDYTIAFLESRMKKMENTLLQKIDQNSTKISDLKKIYSKALSEKKSTPPPKVNEEAYKKQLFQDISKYLSPSTKNLLYEELFINKFSLGDNNTSNKRKRRRCNI